MEELAVKTCESCGGQFEPNRMDPPMCAGCWYSGRWLERCMAGVIEVLTAATETRWEAQHTGGGCFWLNTSNDWDRPPKNGGDGTDPWLLCVSANDGPLGGDSDVAEVEAMGNWCVFISRPWDQAEHDEYEIIIQGDVATEALPLVVRDTWPKFVEMAA